MIRIAVSTLTYLKAWEPHLAAPDAHDLFGVLLRAVNQDERRNSIGYRNYLRDECLVLFDLPLRNKLTRFMMLLTVLTQAHCDKYFLALHAAAYLAVHKQWLTRLLPASRKPQNALDYGKHFETF